MSCRIRAVEHRKCEAGHAGAHPGLQDRLLLNYTVYGKKSFLSEESDTLRSCRVYISPIM